LKYSEKSPQPLFRNQNLNKILNTTALWASKTQSMLLKQSSKWTKNLCQTEKLSS
jgi:predicted alternative tryptophan synthase beta-subunit